METEEEARPEILGKEVEHIIKNTKIENDVKHKEVQLEHIMIPFDQIYTTRVFS